MFNLVERRRLYFLFSSLLILFGIGTLAYSTATTGTPLQLSIDFTGGTLLSLQFREEVGEQDIRDVLSEFNLDTVIVQKLSAIEPEELPENSRWSFKTNPQLSDVAYEEAINALDAIAPVDRENTFNIVDRDVENGGIVIVQFERSVSLEEIEPVISEFPDYTPDSIKVEPTVYPDGSRWSVRTDELTTDDVAAIEALLEARVAPLDRTATEVSQVSESVGREVTQAAFLATLAATAVILGFIYFAFRKVPHPFRYGACAIIAMLHDIMVMVSVMSIMGLVFDWQVDALFLTALLTVVGFSVQDTIVVFDRIRENIPRRRGESYELIVNRSVLETIHRSLATQLNAIFVMVAIVLFGGETIRQFVVILLVGLTSGTYSSIFIAVPLLVSWSKGELPFTKPSID
ncbi:MAG: protein translocase subunit SecF [Phototrophicales bacterium]|nr:MAG: protein translocase subunit SecF [Phototrophicales bacterium]